MSAGRLWRSPLALGGAGVGLALLATVAGSLMALLGGDFACLGGGGTAAAAAPATRAAVREIPPARLRIYEAAGRRFDIDWTFLASIGTQECGSGRCAGDNGSGCAGPMQIADRRESPCSPGSGPTIWERFRTDGNGDGVANVNDPADAIFTAARFLRSALGAPPIGGSYAGYREAACRYYGACADAAANYAEEVMARAVRFGFRGKGAPQPSGQAAAQPAQGIPQGSACEASASSGASSNAIVRVAESQLGRGENPPGSNCTTYGPCEEWCALFVAWVWERAGVAMRGGTSPYAYSGSIYEWVKSHGGRVLAPSARPAPGDAVLYGTGPTNSAHVGIVERVFADGEITTIDGNYGNRVARVGPFLPSHALASGEPAPIYAYAQPPGAAAATEGGVGHG